MNQRFSHILTYTLLVLIAASMFFAIHLFGVNVPHWDDHAIRVFVDNFSWRKIPEIISFHNEHRLGFTRFVALTSNLILGNLDFKSMMFIGQIGLFGLLSCYFFISKEFEFKKTSLIILALFIFNISTFENSLWGMAALQNHWVMFFALASIISLTSLKTKPKVAFIISVFFSTSAILTSGNGILVGPLGLLMLFFLGRKKESLYWLLFHTLIISLYLIGLSATNNTRPHIEDFFLNLFALSGSFVFPILDKSPPNKFIYILGLFNLLFGIWVFIRLFIATNNSKKLICFLAIQGFLIGTIALVAFSRNDYTTLVLLSSKYKIYSFLILGTSLFFYDEFIENKKARIGILVASICLSLNAQYSYYDDSKNLKLERTSDLYNLKQLITDSTKTSYKPPNLAFESALNSQFTILDNNKVDSIAFSGNELLFLERSLDISKSNFIWLKSRDHRTLLPFKANKGIFNASKNWASLDLRNFPSNIYEVYLLESGRLKNSLYDAEKILRIEGIPFEEAPKNW